MNTKRFHGGGWTTAASDPPLFRFIKDTRTIFHRIWRDSNAFNPGPLALRTKRLLEIPHFSPEHRPNPRDTSNRKHEAQRGGEWEEGANVARFLGGGPNKSGRDRAGYTISRGGREEKVGYSLARSTGISASYSICGRFAPRRPLPPGQMISRWSWPLYGVVDP